MKKNDKNIYFMIDMGEDTSELLTKEEEMCLLKRYKEDNDKSAKDELVIKNLRFVNNMVRKNFGNICAMNYNFDADVLFQEGVIGLMEAVDKFDMTKDVRFLSYAGFRVSRSIWLYIYNNSSSMSGCLNLFRNYSRINNILKNDPDLTYQEISEKLNRFLNAEGVKKTIEFVEEKQTIPVYDYLMSSDGEEHSLIEISKWIDGEEELNESLLSTELSDIIENMILQDTNIFPKDSAKRYFRKYYLEGKKYRDIANEEGVSYQAVQQSVTIRLEKVKEKYSKILTDYHIE